MHSSSIVVRAEKLCAGYGHRVVLRDVELWLPEGTFLGVIGPNGSGKSTLLKTLARLIEPREGVVYIDGREVRQYARQELAKRLAVVLTTRPDLKLMRVVDVVALGRYPYTDMFGRLSERDLEIVREVLKLVGIEHLADRLFEELSDGEKQKVLIARALAQQPRVLILDEPTTYLDIRHRIEILHILYRICKEWKVTVIASIHDIDLAAKFCDYVLILKNGRVVKFGPPEEVLTEETLREVFELREVGVKSPLVSPELRVSPDKRVFVVAGAGTGAPIYRALAKRGIGFRTGVLYENDVDYYIAAAVGVEVISCPPYTPPSRDVLERARAAVEEAQIVVDSGFPLGPLVQHNIELLRYAEERGKQVLSLRPDPIAGARASSLSELVSLIERAIR